MGCASGDIELPLGKAAAPRNQRLGVGASLSRLDHQQDAGTFAPAPDGPLGDVTAHLLVGDEDQHEVVGRSLAARRHQVESADQHGESALHVEGAGRPEAVTFQPRGYRIEHRVHVPDQHQRVVPDPRSAGNKERHGPAVAVILRNDLRREAA